MNAGSFRFLSAFAASYAFRVLTFSFEVLYFTLNASNSWSYSSQLRPGSAFHRTMRSISRLISSSLACVHSCCAVNGRTADKSRVSAGLEGKKTPFLPQTGQAGAFRREELAENAGGVCRVTGQHPLLFSVVDGKKLGASESPFARL